MLSGKLVHSSSLSCSRNTMLLFSPLFSTPVQPGPSTSAMRDNSITSTWTVSANFSASNSKTRWSQTPRSLSRQGSSVYRPYSSKPKQECTMTTDYPATPRWVILGREDLNINTYETLAPDCPAWRIAVSSGAQQSVHQTLKAKGLPARREQHQLQT